MDRSAPKRRRRFTENPVTGDEASTSTVTDEFLSPSSLDGDSAESSLARAAAPAYADADLVLGVAAATGAFSRLARSDASSSSSTFIFDQKAPAMGDAGGTATDAAASLTAAGAFSTLTRSDAPSSSSTLISDQKAPSMGDADVAGFSGWNAMGDAGGTATDSAASLTAAVAEASASAVRTGASAASSDATSSVTAAASDATSSLTAAATGANTPPQAGVQRNRWDQAPPCLNCQLSAGERVMTCCGAFLCISCAASNPCGCPRWQEGYGAPVPILPRYVVPLDHFVARAVLLPRERWQLFYTHKTPAGGIVYLFYNVEQAFHRPESGVLVQTHLYDDIVDHVWTRFHCKLAVVQAGGTWNDPEGVLGAFAVPPATENDVATIQGLLDLYRQQQQQQRHH